MFKFNESYLLSLDEKDKGKVKIYNIVKKKHKLKKRIHKVNYQLNIVKINV